MIEIPGPVREKALAAGAPRWLDDLPALVAGLEQDWDITVGRVYPDATESLVTDAETGDGRPAVLKVLVPRPDLAPGDDAGLAPVRHEITALRLAAGGGCVRLLRHDPARGALLLERLGPSLHDIGLPILDRHEILCALALRFWRPGAGHGLPTGAEKARWLASMVPDRWTELGRPCPERVVAHAVACAQRRAAAHDDHRAVLVHGDIHEWNALSTGRPAPDDWALVDPDGLLAEPEYDLGVLMREDPVDLLDGDPYARVRWLAERTGLDPVAIWEWGVVERVSTGLIAERIGLQPVGRQMLAAAERLAGLPGPG